MIKSLYKTYLEKLLEFPLWIKQVIFKTLSDDFSKNLDSNISDLQYGEQFYLYRPVLSENALDELTHKTSKFNADIYKFLLGCSNGMSIAEIAVENNFSMVDVSYIFMFCLNSDFFATEIPKYIKAIAGFLSGKYKTGEYLIRIGKLTYEQLDSLLLQQQTLNGVGEHVFIADLMVRMGFVNESDVANIIFMKQEASKPLSIGVSGMPIAELEQKNKSLLVANTQLREENEILREKVNALLKFINEHKEQH